MATDKDTIYIDIDDEITGIIDKLRASQAKVIALVLPKRAAVFQSIVNMKLLKRASETDKKNIILVTTEAGLLPLAGAAGIYVAKTLTSKPELPPSPEGLNDTEEMVDENDAEAEPIVDPNTPVGELAGSAPAPAGTEDVETLVLDDDEVPPEEEADGQETPTKSFEPPTKKDKKLHVPNFERFRLLIIIGALIIIGLIVAAIVAVKALPKATINVSTNSTNVPVNLNINLSTSASTLDTSSDTLPAKLLSQQKTYTETAPTTGQENEGNKASGSITVSAGACGQTVPADIPSGTGVSSNNLTYITQDDITFQPVLSHGQCSFEGLDAKTNQPNIPITAQSGGSSYNTSGTPFTIADYSSYTATGSTSGGTDNIVQTVNQNDINNAKAKVSTSDPTIKQALENQLQQDGYYAIDSTYNAGTPTVSSSNNVGDTASSVTITETVSYSMFGVHQSDLKTLVDSNVDSQIDTTKQSILSEGLSNATFGLTSSTATTAQLAMQTTAVAGPELSASTIKQEVAGKRSGDVKTELEANPNVTGVTVNYSPFWVSSVPTNQSRITVNIAPPSTSVKSNASNP